MPKIEWTDDLSVNIYKFDNEHKKLVELLNKLNDAMSQGQGQKVLSGILSELSTYTKTHFKNEEDAMEKYNYPGKQQQKTQHAEFINKLQEMQTQYNSGTLSLSISVFNFLVNWVQNHIKREDQKYSEFFVKNGMR